MLLLLLLPLLPLLPPLPLLLLPSPLLLQWAASVDARSPANVTCPLQAEAEAEVIAAAQAQQGAAGQMGKKKKKKLDRVQLYREIPMFIVFGTIFCTSLMTRRDTAGAFYMVGDEPEPLPCGRHYEGASAGVITRCHCCRYCRQVNALRVGLVEEAFGDYNEKEYMDIRNFEEIFVSALLIPDPLKSS